MARINKNGNLSGAVGNLVFVQNGKNQYVRSKPTKVKQSASTKKAASLFGWVSTRDKVYRQVLMEKFSLLSDSRYATRHRARMKKTLVSLLPVPTTLSDWSFENPEALVGFDFNEHLPWQKCTQFYPDFVMDDMGNGQVEIPTLSWGNQIKPPKKTKSAHLKLEAFTLDPNAENIEITTLSSLNLNISATQDQEPIIWSFSAPQSNHWILIMGILSFDRGDSQLSPLERTSTCYLWAKNLKAI